MSMSISILRSLTENAVKVVTSVSWVAWREQTAAGRTADKRATFRLDGSFPSAELAVAELAKMHKEDEALPAALKRTVRLNVPKRTDGNVTVALRPVYLPGPLAVLVAEQAGLPNPFPPAAPRKQRKAKDGAADGADASANGHAAAEPAAAGA